MIDPGAISLIQATFLNHINDAFLLVVHYALDLLYLFAAFEIVFIGFAWAMQQDIAWGRALFKIIKIGLIFFIIQNYAELTNVIVRSFAQMGGIVANTAHLSEIIFNPAKIWAFGYDNGLILLKAATASTSFGLSLIQIILGMGIVFTFGLLGIQIVLQVVGFYFVALISLVFLPFGAFNPSANMFERAVQSVLQAGVKVMVLITVIGVAVTVWGTFNLAQMGVPFNINAPMGLFFTALLFLYLAIKLPNISAKAVGQISMHFSGNVSAAVVQVSSRANEIPAVGQAAMSAVQEASFISPAAVQLGRGVETSGGISAGTATLAAAGAAAPQSMQPTVGKEFVSGKRGDTIGMVSAQRLERSISDATVKKIKKTFAQTLEEQELKQSISE